MKSVLVLLAIVLLSAPVSSSARAGSIGVRSFVAPAPERGRDIEVMLWYPASAGGEPVLIGDNAVFRGVPAQRDAPVAEGSFPVILLSHGGLRAAPGRAGWIAAELAAKGFIVAVSQGPSPLDLAAAEGPRELWLRPADLSAALTALERATDLAGRADFHRVGVLGFHLGGTAALALAGARLDHRAYGRSCEADGSERDCAWFRRHGVDLRKVDAAQVGRSNLDARVRAVVAIDSEYAAALSEESLSGMSVPVHIIDLGRRDEVGQGPTAIEWAGSIMGGRHDVVAGATHFDTFSRCKPAGAEILRSEGDDGALCAEGEESREAIHARLAAMILSTFEQELRGGS